MKMYPPDGPDSVVRVRGDMRTVVSRRIFYPPVPPYESPEYARDENRAGHAFRFPGTPEQAYRQSVRSSAIANLPCGNCKLCLDCLRLERS